jgi:hypothetical protein
MADLAEFDRYVDGQEEGIPVELLKPDFVTPLGVTIRVAGPDSKLRRKAVAEIIAAASKAQNSATIGPEWDEKFWFEVFVKTTTSWAPNFSLGGEELECNEANARKVYDRYRFIYDQIKTRANNRAAFYASLATPSVEP